MKLHTILPEQVYQRGHMQGLQNRASELSARGIGTVIALWGEYDSEMAAFRYVHEPFPDGRLEYSQAGRLLALAQYAAVEARKEQKSILTHCYGGLNRSGLMSALLVRVLTNCTGAEALAHVQRARPRSLDNRHFCTFLSGLAVPEAG